MRKKNLSRRNFLNLLFGTSAGAAITAMFQNCAPSFMSSLTSGPGTSEQLSINTFAPPLPADPIEEPGAAANDFVTPEMFGAVGDGVTDDGLAFTKASQHCAKTGSTLKLSPNKNYYKARLEVQGTFNVDGAGATIQFLGMGQTIVGGSGFNTSAQLTPWPTDPDSTPWLPPTSLYKITQPLDSGEKVIHLESTSHLRAGQILFMAGNPSSFSSDNNGPNFIPLDFEFVKIKSVNNLSIEIETPTLSSYKPGAGLFFTPGLAINCRVSNLKVNSSTDAYQFCVRSSFNCVIENVRFEGTSTVGASTFSEGLVFENIFVAGSFGSLSTARGTVSTTFKNVVWNKKQGNSSLAAIFIEESLYNVTFENFSAYGGILCLQNLDGGSKPQRPKNIILKNCLFDATTTYGGPTAPLQGSVAISVNITADNCTFKGAVATPTGNYIGITGDAFMWIGARQTWDVTQFKACRFISLNKGRVWPSAIAGFLGTVDFDSECTFSETLIRNS
jgi:hypothetical protein